ncbi:MAG TPA: GntR family transcriptional regulator [Acidisoma sp.]|nr:GntR family transcriptional regulator [Acidisoma sp.]
MTPIERPQSLADAVLERLRYDIVSGKLRLGQMLSERVLAEKLGVSKSPVREALAQLRLEGLVRIVPQRGAFVFTLSSEGVRQVCEFRRMLERTALTLAVAREPHRLARLWAAIVEEMAQARAAGDGRRYLDADTTFHTTLFDLCGNAYISGAYSLHLGKIAALRTHLAVKPLHTEMSFREHGEMAAAIDRGDLAATLAILDVHIDRSQTTYAAGVPDIAQADASEERAVRPRRARSRLVTAAS